MLLVACVSACGAAQRGSHGATRAQYRGGTALVFTNASPEKMCELRMAFDEAEAYGDNWLPPGGLASGKSIEFRVEPGTYKATWTTCRTERGMLAGTRWRELAFRVDQQTQLFAYVADRVAPTSRARVLGDDYKIVRFQGQPVGRYGDAKVTASRKRTVDHFAEMERELADNSGQRAPDPGISRFASAD